MNPRARTILGDLAWIAALVMAVSLGFAHGAQSARAKGSGKQSQPAIQPAQPQPQTPPKHDSSAKQPHMEAALNQLQAAQYDLSQTSRGKGGWVEIAQGHISSAISAVRQGISYGQSH